MVKILLQSPLLDMTSCQHVQLYDNFEGLMTAI